MDIEAKVGMLRASGSPICARGYANLAISQLDEEFAVNGRHVRGVALGVEAAETRVAEDDTEQRPGWIPGVDV